MGSNQLPVTLGSMINTAWQKQFVDILNDLHVHGPLIPRNDIFTS